MVKWEYAMFVINPACANFVMQDWEEVIEHDGNATTTLKYLNNYGADGWEVFDVRLLDTGITIYSLKRPVSED